MSEVSISSHFFFRWNFHFRMQKGTSSDGSTRLEPFSSRVRMILRPLHLHQLGSLLISGREWAEAASNTKKAARSHCVIRDIGGSQISDSYHISAYNATEGSSHAPKCPFYLWPLVAAMLRQCYDDVTRQTRIAQECPKDARTTSFPFGPSEPPSSHHRKTQEKAKISEKERS
jgi:hypothetical protein